ncbi:MAG: PAS domain S-box protein [bacterium]
MNNKSKVLKDIFMLYELALSIGKSLDLKEDCAIFLKALMSRQNLGFASIWIKNEYLDKEDKEYASLIYAYPEFRVKETRLPLNHPLFTLPEGRKFWTVASSEPDFSQVVTEKEIEKEAFAVFSLNNLGFLKLVKETPFEEEGLYQLCDVISEFAASLKGCLSHQKLKQSGERLKLYQYMVESAHDAIFFKDLESRYIIANNKALEAFGLSREEVIGKNDFELMQDKEEAKKNVEDDQTVFKTGKPQEITKHMTDAAGKKYWFQAIKVPQFDDNGNIIGLVGIARDITRQKWMEEELRKHTDHLEELVQEQTVELKNEIMEHKRTEKLLAESEEKFRLAFDNAKDAIFWADPQTGLITNCNKSAAVLLEKEKSEIIGSHQITVHPPEKAQYYAEMFRKHIEHKGWADDEAEVITKSGKIIPVNITASVTLIRGNPIIQGIFHDITEQKRLQKKLIETEKLAATARIAAEAAHEVKNPLQVIKSGLYYLKITHKEDIDAQQTIQQMDNAIGRATGFINDLLNLSKPFELKTAKCQVNKLIKEAIKELPAELLSNIDVTQKLASDLPEINVDSDRIRQVLVNLVKNAAEAMGEVKSKKLRVKTEREGDFIKIGISDTGKGIVREEISKIFEPFYTGRGKGIGLGLAICQRLIEAHQGRIEVESEVGKGTTFVVFLPI